MDGEDTLQTLRPGYLRRLGERVSLLEKLASEPEARGEIHRIAHSMGSSAMIYGYAASAARRGSSRRCSTRKPSMPRRWTGICVN